MYGYLNNYINVLTVALARKRGRGSGWTSSHSWLNPNTNLTLYLWVSAAEGKCIVQGEFP